MIRAILGFAALVGATLTLVFGIAAGFVGLAVTVLVMLLVVALGEASKTGDRMAAAALGHASTDEDGQPRVEVAGRDFWKSNRYDGGRAA